MIQIIIWELCKDSVKKRISHSTLRQAVFAQSLNGTGIEIVTMNLDNFILYISVCLQMSGLCVRMVAEIKNLPANGSFYICICWLVLQWR